MLCGGPDNCQCASDLLDLLQQLQNSIQDQHACVTQDPGFWGAAGLLEAYRLTMKLALGWSECLGIKVMLQSLSERSISERNSARKGPMRARKVCQA